MLVMTAVEVEREAVLRGVRGDSRFEVLVAGVGPISAAVRTTTALAMANGSEASGFDLVVSAGIGGGFANQADIGTIVVASEVIAADLGVQTLDGFSSIDELGFGTNRLQVEPDLSSRLVEALRAGGLTVGFGPILTLSTATGTAATTAELAKRIPGASAEAMEGFGVAAAAYSRNVPFLEIRGISNRVGPRDRESWRIGEALAALEAACSHLSEVIS